MDVVKVSVEVPKASYELVEGVKKVVVDVVKALENGWQPWDDVRDLVDSVTKNLVPVAGGVTKIPSEFKADPAAFARLGGVVLGEAVAFAVVKLRK